MLFLRSCVIIYEDLTRKNVEECDGIQSLFSMTNISLLDILILLAIFLITIYFILKIKILLKKEEPAEDKPRYFKIIEKN